MNTDQEYRVGYIVRCYSCDSDRMDYAGIIAAICESPEEAADAVVEHLEQYLCDVDEKEVSEEEWNAIRKRISGAFLDTIAVEIKPARYPELEDRIVPESIKINKVLLSDRLVQRIKENAKESQQPIKDDDKHTENAIP